MIRVYKEPDPEPPFELCVFCRNPTPFWYFPNGIDNKKTINNNEVACCEPCAKLAEQTAPILVASRQTPKWPQKGPLFARLRGEHVEWRAVTIACVVDDVKPCVNLLAGAFSKIIVVLDLYESAERVLVLDSGTVLANRPAVGDGVYPP